jgi:hypothetical protein
MEFELLPHHAGGASLNRIPGGWRMEMPAGLLHTYRLAQLDDFTGLPRKSLLHTSPCTLTLKARLSSADIPGTWGFGFWNDPFGLSLGFGGHTARLPALPQTAWFFHASPPNWLSLRDATGVGQAIPANGFFAGTFCSPHIPPLLLVPALPVFSLCAIRLISRIFRRLAGSIIHQAGVKMTIDVTDWHEYAILWLPEGCRFLVDGELVLETDQVPHSPLGLVIWIDNQYAAWTPEGSLAFGRLKNPAAWLEIKTMDVRRGQQPQN